MTAEGVVCWGERNAAGGCCSCSRDFSSCNCGELTTSLSRGDGDLFVGIQLACTLFTTIPPTLGVEVLETEGGRTVPRATAGRFSLDWEEETIPAADSAEPGYGGIDGLPVPDWVEFE